MRRPLFLFLFCLEAFIANAQFQIELQGLDDLTIELNDINKTASICCYETYIQDAKNKVSAKRRSVKYFSKNAPNALIIPATYKHPHTKVTYTITAIGDAAFAEVKNFNTVILPPTIRDIGRYAFYGSSLVNVNLPASVRTVGDWAFGNCTSLISLRIPRIATLGLNIYAQSRKTKLQQYNTGNENYQASNTEMKKTGKTSTPAAPVINSDVDVNIPNLGQQNEETFAMIIANETYDTEVPVQYANHDGKIFKEYCEKILGLNPKHIYYEENATLGKMNGLIDRLITAAEAFDGSAKFIVYYAGHGIPDETTGEAYLLPTDGNGQNMKTAFSLKDFYRQLGGLNAKSVVVFMDACFSGAQRGDGMLMAARGVAIKPQEQKPQLGNTIVFSAASNNETAWPYKEKGHGLFTYFLLKKLRESKGQTTLGELDAFITRNVKRSIVDLPYAKKQTPKTDASPTLIIDWQNMKLK